VLFGTDILKVDELLPAKRNHDATIASLGLPEETLERIYGSTAARLLGIDPA
jgi:predicted TIM-barrel fold metal-dependent hydrolase